ncbi:DUF411 domain-containing protein [Rhizobium bangladeshense]|uniref:DUF411 domain-containing protein n=1 Tax=Rhizobium bangladeshense TaxID=1138189 RepID=UPI001A993BC9|nr:DUF411 domain-containing protein [Rhizobium bangladeshense]MBX4890906.1 DUF411 domain-containing protein [Rhizobium bangladeshense]MBX4916375.1 DUF411 domain-containing protein [Rhizobium bangladeshense]MBX4922588.1 DUF411 domain-containing protein [Rhizobium bangladeshense]MBX4931627.1 DUF411 domain-containing protein [Rhizobium bangladeshense]MBY3582513.1 DUF411 domain-containing protein [Rhizobium bangladeshense]
MKRRAFMCLAATSAIAAITRPVSASQLRMDVYKDPTCGCCEAWSKAMADADFNVVVRDEDFMAMKAKLGIPENMQGCHTAVVGDYFFEGHVPLEAVEKVMSEKPRIAGLAVPGMPAGSLGMGDDPKAAYEVYSLSKPEMTPTMFMRIGKA